MVRFCDNLEREREKIRFCTFVDVDVIPKVISYFSLSYYFFALSPSLMLFFSSPQGGIYRRNKLFSFFLLDIPSSTLNWLSFDGTGDVRGEKKRRRE